MFPLVGPISTQAPLDIPPPPVTAAADFVVSILSSFGLPVDAVEPVVLDVRVEWRRRVPAPEPADGCAAEQGLVRAIFVVERRHRLLAGRVHASRAVIFLPRDESGTTVGPMITLPAHELGHTFGLSVDSRLKTSWVCDIDWPVVGHAACGLVGGFDEYNHEDPNLQDGNPASGYWVAAREPSRRCSTRWPITSNATRTASWVIRRLMPHKNWPALGRWIDPADYDHLIDQAGDQHPDPEVVYVSGMISWHNQIHVGRCVRLDAGLPDHSAETGMYGFRFLNRGGTARSAKWACRWPGITLSSNA